MAAPPPDTHPGEIGHDRARTRRYLLIALCAALVLAVWGIVSRVHARRALERQSMQAAIPTVTTTHARPGPPSDALILPGSVYAYYEAPIYARTSGYLKNWYTDIGATVKKGQLLGDIETPEVDQQLRQAQADLGTAEANYELARTTNVRWQGLLATQSVSQQDADQRAGDAAAKLAARKSAAANVARLLELESFKRLVAPFDGIVTQRSTDVGALINAGESGNALFRVADTHKLRIYVYVPQLYAAHMRPGLTAGLEFADHPGQPFAAQVTSTANALDSNSRTLQVELQIDNPRGELLPGAYVQVKFSLPSDTGSLRIPVNTVLFRGPQLQVATVDDGRHVRLKQITEGRDFGTEIEVLAGVTVDDTLIVNPPDSAADGMEVRIQQRAPAAEQQPHQGKSATGGRSS
jgi:RND family efflux transporter MFP subunit